MRASAEQEVTYVAGCVMTEGGCRPVVHEVREGSGAASLVRQLEEGPTCIYVGPELESSALAEAHALGWIRRERARS